MKALEKCWAYVLYILNALSLSDHGKQVQEPLGGMSSHVKDLGGPVFSPPSTPDNFTCNYTLMGMSWSHCTQPNDRGCWLTNGTFNYSIFTNYEKLAPTGILRKYELDVTKMTLEPDGYKFTEGQVFNKQYPGPWIQACWGEDGPPKPRFRMLLCSMNSPLLVAMPRIVTASERVYDSSLHTQETRSRQRHELSLSSLLRK